MCLRGASAVQTVLDERRDRRLRVLLVWEPVIVTDLGPPTGSTLSRVPDGRVVQFWDRKRHLSRRITGTHEEEGIVWDYVAVYPPGVRWEGESFPVPVFSASPVVDGLDGLRAGL